MFLNTVTTVLLSHCNINCGLKYATRSLSTTIGFIGLGNMGSKMAQNLLSKGEKLIIYDAQSSSVELFDSKPNVFIANDIKELAAKSTHVITMLPNNDAVWSTYIGENGILKNCLKKSTVFIDCSTIDPEIAQKISLVAKETGHLFLDAPVSGGVVGAEAGTLTFMVGGCEMTPQQVQSLLLKMGARVINCGSSGMGQAAKLCNNMLLGTTMVAVAETMNLGIKFGLDVDTLTSIINSSSGRCWSTEVNHPVPGVLKTAPSSREYKGGFRTSLLMKDMNLALKMAEKTNLSVPLANTALKIYNTAISKKDFADLDFSVIYKAIAEKGGN